MLARNPLTPSRALGERPVSGTAFDRGVVTGRLLAERFGDDVRAFSVAAELLEAHVGTYAGLVDAVAVSVSAPATAVS